MTCRAAGPGPWAPHGRRGSGRGSGSRRSGQDLSESLRSGQPESRHPGPARVRVPALSPSPAPSPSPQFESESRHPVRVKVLARGVRRPDCARKPRRIAARRAAGRGDTEPSVIDCLRGLIDFLGGLIYCLGGNRAEASTLAALPIGAGSGPSAQPFTGREMAAAVPVPPPTLYRDVADAVVPPSVSAQVEVGRVRGKRVQSDRAAHTTALSPAVASGSTADVSVHPFLFIFLFPDRRRHSDGGRPRRRGGSAASLRRGARRGRRT